MGRATPAPADSHAWLRFSRQLGLGFGLRYALIAGVLFGVYAFPFELFGAREDWLQGYLAGYARLAGALLALLEPGLTVQGTLIYGRFPLQIVRNCDAADVNILFASAMLALPGPFLSKLAPLAAGLLALIAANVLRICSLYYVGVLAPDRFKLAHEEIWPLLLVALAVGAFVVCSRRLAPALASAAQ